MSRYYIADGMVQRGPFEIADLPGQGVRAGTLVWKVGMDQWRRADAVEELIFAGVLGPVTSPLPSFAYSAPAGAAGTGAAGVAVPTLSAVNSNRVAAGICGIVLGGLGVHKFILGMNGPGIAMLLISVVGWFLTCGMASMVMGVIGLIEGIIYLTRTDEQFYQDYVVGRKGWF